MHFYSNPHSHTLFRSNGAHCGFVLENEQRRMQLPHDHITPHTDNLVDNKGAFVQENYANLHNASEWLCINLSFTLESDV